MWLPLTLGTSYIALLGFYSPIAKFQGTGDLSAYNAQAGKRVEKIKYDKKRFRVYINQHHYFEGIPENVWQYRIGGYQVCNKWLKDRKEFNRFLKITILKLILGYIIM